MAPARIEDLDFDVSIPEVKVTEQRRPFIQKKGDEQLKQPGIARANEAASVEAPRGTQTDDYAKRHKHQTVLQQHCDFFDTDSDGILWPLDTYRGFHRLGYGITLCVISVLVIHINFSYPTVSGILPDPFFRIFLKRVHKANHGSDSGAYDKEGRFIPQKFEDIFAKYATGDKQSISASEIWDYFKGQRGVMDPIGWAGGIFEWLITWVLLWPEDGRMKKEDIRKIYDGSLLFEIAAKREKKE